MAVRAGDRFDFSDIFSVDFLLFGGLVVVASGLTGAAVLILTISGHSSLK